MLLFLACNPASFLLGELLEPIERAEDWREEGIRPGYGDKIDGFLLMNWNYWLYRS